MYIFLRIDYLALTLSLSLPLSLPPAISSYQLSHPSLSLSLFTPLTLSPSLSLCVSSPSAPPHVRFHPQSSPVFAETTREGVRHGD